MVTAAEDLARGIDRLQQSWILPGVDPLWPITALCVWEPFLLAAARDQAVNLYDISPTTSSAAAPEIVKSVRVQRAVLCLAASSSIAYFADGSSSIACHRWSRNGVESAPESWLVGHTRPVTAIAHSEGLIYSASNDLTVRLWDVASGQVIATLAQDIEPPSSLSVVDAKILSASHAGGGCLALWQYSFLQAAAQEWCSILPLLGALFVRAPQALDHAAEPRTSQMDCVHTSVQSENRIHCAVHAGADVALSASLTGQIQVWDLQSFNKVGEWHYEHFGHESPLSAIALLSDLVFTASMDGTLRLTRCPVLDAHNSNEERASEESFGRLRSYSDDMLRGVHDPVELRE